MQSTKMSCVNVLTICILSLILGTLAEFDNDFTNYIDICSVLPKPATILSPGTCTKWINCGMAEDFVDTEQGTCLVGLYYDKDTGRCESSEKVSCPYERESVSPCQNVSDGTYLENPENCTSFIYCKDGEALRDYCPGDLVFHPQKAECVYKQDYACPTKSEKPKPHPICNSVKDGLAFADKFSCKTYHYCRRGVLITAKCENGTAFDYVLGKCVSQDATCLPTALEAEPELTACGTSDLPKEGYIPDEKSCSGYYFCKRVQGGVDREPKFARCPNGFFFDAETLSCRDRLNVRCDKDRCEGMGNRYVNIPGDCASYARCKGDVVTTTGKCPEKYYFDEKTQGCTPQKINYIACSA